MAGLQLSGLASGFDWKSVVDQLIAIDRTPQDKLRVDESDNQAKLSAFTTLRTKIATLQTAAKALSSDSLFGKRLVSQSNSDLKWVASAADSTAAGAYTINVSTLATATQRAGADGRAAALNASNNVGSVLVSDLRLAVPIKDGMFTINGEQIQVASTDTLGDVFAKISTATSGAVTATYDASADRVSLAGTGPINLGSGVDSSNFLYALKLYNNNGSTVRSAANLGTINLRDSVRDAGLATAITATDSSGNGTLEINGTSISYNVNNDSLQTIMDRVNASAAGVTMSYDAAHDHFNLVNDSTGDVGLNVSEANGGLLGALGLASAATVTRGHNAVFSVNGGGSIVSASNVLDESVTGIKGLTVTATSTGQENVTVASDTTNLDKGIRALITAFNDVQKFVDDQTKVSVGTDGKVTAAQFAGNRELTDMAQNLRNMIFDQVPGVTAAFSRLANIGIDFNGASSQLSVRDEAAFKDALTNHLSDVTSLFTKATTGISAKLNGYVTNVSRGSGVIDTQEQTLKKQNTSIDKQISDLDRTLDAERTRLEAGFIQMEQVQQNLNTQLAALKQTFNIT